MEYQTIDGEETTLYRLVRDEPDWAISRITFMQEEIQRLSKIAGQRGARMQMMREWMITGEPKNWRLMDEWFDTHGVPFNE